MRQVETYSVELTSGQSLYSTKCKRIDCHHGGYFGERQWSIILLTLLSAPLQLRETASHTMHMEKERHATGGEELIHED